jgi:DNA polymerase III epsilon subunit family exonuclease
MLTMNEKYQKFLERTFTVFDVETSGLNPQKDDVLEIAAVKLKGKDIVDRFEALAQPTKPIPPEAERVHGLNEIYLLVNGQGVDVVIKNFLNFIGDSIVVGHNIRGFDWLFILYYAQRLKLATPENKLIDTLELSRKLLTLNSHTLTNVASHFGYEHVDAHRAMPDVEMNTKVFIDLMEQLLKN